MNSTLELVISFVLGTISSILATIILEKTQSHLKRHSRSFANKELNELKGDCERIKKLRGQPNFLYTTFAGQTLHAISSLFVVILVLSVSFALALIISTQIDLGLFPFVVVAVIGTVFAYAGFRAVSEKTLDIYRVIEFDAYELEIRERIESLEKSIADSKN